MREQIIREADRLIRTGGYEALNFGTIAAKLGTTRANLHYHFKNKENLALTVTDRYIAEVRSRLTRLRRTYAGNFPAILLALDADLWERLSALSYKGYCVCARLIADQAQSPYPLLQKAEEHFEWLVNAFSEEIGASQVSGRMKADRPARELALESLSIYLGVAQMAMSLAPEREADSYSRRRIGEWLATVT